MANALQPSVCPSCGSALNPDAVVCIKCGYDRRKGARLQTTSSVEEAAELRYFQVRSTTCYGGTRSLYRVYVVAEDLLFVRLGSGDDLNPPPVNAVGMGGGLIGGLVAGIAAAARAAQAAKLKREIEEREWQLDGIDETDLRRLVKKDKKSFLLAAEDIEEARLEPKTLWRRMFWGIKGPATLQVTHNTRGKLFLELVAERDMNRATKRLRKLKLLDAEVEDATDDPVEEAAPAAELSGAIRAGEPAAGRSRPTEEPRARNHKKKQRQREETRAARSSVRWALPVGAAAAAVVVCLCVALLWYGLRDENDIPAVAGPLPEGVIFAPGSVVRVQADCETSERTASAKSALADILRREGYKIGSGGWALRVTAFGFDIPTRFTGPGGHQLRHPEVRGSLCLIAPDGREMYTQSITGRFSLISSKYFKGAKRPFRAPMGDETYSFDFGNRPAEEALAEEAWEKFLANLTSAPWPRTLRSSPALDAPPAVVQAVVPPAPAPQPAPAAVAVAPVPATPAPEPTAPETKVASPAPAPEPQPLATAPATPNPAPPRPTRLPTPSPTPVPPPVAVAAKPAPIPPVTARPRVEGPELVPFEAPPNPYREGTQTRLRKLRTLKTPSAAVQLVYSAQHQLLFVRNATNGIWVVDVKAATPGAKQLARHKLSDMSLTADESALYAADYGGTRIGYGEPSQPSFVHRYNLKERKWETRQAPKIAFRVEAVDTWRFLLLEQDQWVKATLNQWDEQTEEIAELARVGSNVSGDLEYDPHTLRLYHGNSGSSSPEIAVFRVNRDLLQPLEKTGTYGSAKQGGGSATLSIDGRHFYYGRLQVDAQDIKRNLQMFPEIISAASRDVAFGTKAYYHAQTGKRLGELGYPLTACCISRDEGVVWAFDSSKNALHKYALEGDK